MSYFGCKPQKLFSRLNSPAILEFFDIILILFWQFRRKAGVWLIFIGGISNLLDRIFRGGVVDFLSLLFIPTFNFADAAICLGAAFLLVDYFKLKKLS